jgi:hypothetical protein
MDIVYIAWIFWAIGTNADSRIPRSPRLPGGAKDIIKGETQGTEWL